MDSFWDLFKPDELIRYGGMVLLVIIIFLENGVFFGFFLPGDSLLFTAGLLCYLGVLSIALPHLILFIGLAAIAGYYAGYWFGYHTGAALYKKEDTLFYKKKYITTAENFYKKYGGAALILGRFLPIIRTFAPILAGIVKVKAHIFFIYNVIGAFVWPAVIVTGGYYAGQLIPNALDYLNWVIVGFILVTSLPIISSLRKDKKTKEETTASNDVPKPF